MANPVRTFLARRTRSLSAFACLLAVSMQLALPALHQAHGGHEARLVATNEGAGFLGAQAPQADPATTHEPATCPQCRMLSHSVAPVLHTTCLGAPAVRASLLEDWSAARSPSALSGHEGPARAPPFPA